MSFGRAIALHNLTCTYNSVESSDSTGHFGNTWVYELNCVVRCITSRVYVLLILFCKSFDTRSLALQCIVLIGIPD